MKLLAFRFNATAAGKVLYPAWQDASELADAIIEEGDVIEYAYSAPVLTDEMVRRSALVVCENAGERWERIGEFAQSVIFDTQRAALAAALGAPDAPE